jgi:hypothetical protein
MGAIKLYRHPEISLWQSIFDETASAGRAGPRPDLKHPLMAAAADLGERIMAASAPPPGLPPVPSASTPIHNIADVLHHGHDFVGRLWQNVKGAVTDVERFRELLMTRYDTFDPRWVEALLEYAKYYVLSQTPVPYRRCHSLDDFVIDDKLPAQARLAIVGDWGTGQPEALHLLQQIADKKPHVFLHLGDIYYSGLASEIRRAFVEPCEQILRPVVPNCVIFSLCGNHDLYGGGRPYYQLLDQIGQPASFFCLRNDHWQLLAIDTGLHGRYLPDRPTHLKESERQWLQYQIEHADGRHSLLFSHHQLYSAFEAIAETADEPINQRLYEQLAPLLPQLSGWFWGHEHNFIVYGDYLGCRTRCLGHGAVPVPVPVNSNKPVPRRSKEIPVLDVRLGATGDFYNHGYAILDLDGPKAHVAYFQESDDAHPLYEEDL